MGKRIVSFIVVATLLITGLFVLTGCQVMEDLGFDSTTDYSKVSVMKMDYKVLHKDYMDNPIAADEKYKGKVLELTGQVDIIDREIAGNPYVTFEVDLLENVRITFKKSEESKVTKLVKGQTITIRGKCKGTLLSTTVALDNCELVN